MAVVEPQKTFLYWLRVSQKCFETPSEYCPQARLKQVFLTAFTIWKSVPLLRMVSQSDYGLLLEKMPPQKVQEHLQSDRDFIDVLIERCKEAGIPFTAETSQVAGLMNALFFVSLHEDDFGPQTFPGTIDLLLDLIAQYCVGIITRNGESPGIDPGALT
jgi:hypothetical protein